jgi:hypothetical protein
MRAYLLLKIEVPRAGAVVFGSYSGVLAAPERYQVGGVLSMFR